MKITGHRFPVGLEAAKQRGSIRLVIVELHTEEVGKKRNRETGVYLSLPSTRCHLKQRSCIIGTYALQVTRQMQEKKKQPLFFNGK